MTNTIYVAHRENQREAILEAAEDLFILKGIEPVTIGEVADAARLTRATIYKYFSNKEEIAQEIFKTITKVWRDRNERDVWGFQGTGYQRLERFLNYFFINLFQNPREASFVGEFNYLYAKKLTAAIFVETMLENLVEDKEFVFGCFEQGLKDGSLRSDMDANMGTAVFFNFISGMISRIGEMGGKVEQEFGISAETIFIQIGRIYLEGLRSPISLHKQ